MKIEVEEIKKVKLEENDILIIKINGDGMTKDKFSDAQRSVEKYLNTKVLILDKDADVEVYTKNHCQTTK